MSLNVTGRGRHAAAEALGDLVSQTRFNRLPSQVVHEAKRRVLDIVGIALSASKTETGRKIQSYVRAQGENGRASLFGTKAKVNPKMAALANGSMVFHMELDDVHMTSHTHPAISTVIPSLALAEQLNRSGEAVIEAIVVGYEVQARLGNVVSPSIYVDRPFMPAAILGTFGAAASSSKLFGFPAQKVMTALGTASFLTPLALYENYVQGASAKELSMGWASMSGMMAVELAEQGFSGAPSWLEGPLGFAVAAADRYDFERLFNGIGKEYEILKTGIKPYACCRQHHTAIDAALEIRGRDHPSMEEIEKIVHRTFKVAGRGNNPRPTTIAGAKYSSPYSIAVALMEGKAWREQYTPEKLKDEKLLSLAGKVQVVVDPDLDALYDLKWPSLVEVYMKNGGCFKAGRELPKGEPAYPVSDEELGKKYLSLAGDAVSEKRAEALLKKVMDLETLATIEELTVLLQPE